MRERAIAAIAIARDGLLLLAGSLVRGAGQADVEMIIVAPHRPHLGKPGPIPLGLPADGPLDRGIHENTLDLAIARGGFDGAHRIWSPNAGIDI